MTLVAAAPRDDRLPWRIGAALGALLVAAIVVFGLGALFFSAMPAAPTSPFGVGIREAAQGGSGFGGWLLARQAWFYQRMAAALRAASDHGGLGLGLVALAFAYGVFHAGGPGHGKAVISAYLIATGAALRRGIALAVAAALMQAVMAVLIVLGATFVLRATAPGMTALTDRIELVSFAAIALFGLALTWRKAGPVAARLARAHRADFGADRRAAPLAQADDGHAHAHAHGEAHHHPAHDHHAPRGHQGDHHHAPYVEHDHHDACRHHVPLELVRSADFRWRDAVPVVLAAGLRPCSGAIIVLVFALSQHLVIAGLSAVFAMAAGVAITVGGLAVMSVFARRAALRFAGGEGRYAMAGAAIELLAAAFVAVVGCGLMGGLAMISAG